MSSIKNITVPDLGSATDVSVIEILVKPGDRIQNNASIVTLESDKATMELPTTDAGVVKEIKVKVGDKVSMGSTILTLETEGAEKQPSQPAKEKYDAKQQPAKETKAAASTSTRAQEAEVAVATKSPEKEKTRAGCAFVSRSCTCR